MEKRKHTHNNRIPDRAKDKTSTLSVSQAKTMGLRKIDKACVKVVKKKSVQLTVTQRFNQRFVTLHESPEIAKHFATSQYQTGTFKIEWNNAFGNKELLTGNCDRLHGLRRFAFQASRSDLFGQVCDTARRGENEQLLIELSERTDTQFNNEGIATTRILARRSLIVLGGKKDTGSYVSFPTTIVNIKGETITYQEKLRVTSDAEKKLIRKGLSLHGASRKLAQSNFRTINEAERIVRARCVALGFMLPFSACQSRPQQHFVYRSEMLTLAFDKALEFTIKNISVNESRPAAISLTPLSLQQSAFLLSPLSAQAAQDRLKYCKIKS